jgi:two-component system LytT family sensor kinase
MWISQPYKNPWIRILAHAGFWIGYLLLNFLTAFKFYPESEGLKLLLQFTITLPVDILATYFTVYFLYPWILYKRRYVLFAIAILVSALLFIILQRTLIYYITYPNFYVGLKPKYGFWEINWFYNFTNIYLVVGVVSVIKLMKISLEQQKNARELDHEKNEAELKFLKAQVHPHFLFNTLNNLYALALDKSDRTPEVVLKLSDLLNYMLYECNEPYMLVTKEIQLLENYLSLEQIRYGDNLALEFQVTGEITGKRLAPMLLLPFVENAFKHGVSKVRKNPSVHINLDITGNTLHFAVRNSRSMLPETDLTGYTEGIGLKNVKRRLELLYPGRHHLLMEQNEGEYCIHLKVNLSSYYER